MQYNRRTARLIQNWFVQHGRKHLHICILEEVFKNAWREKELSALPRVNYLGLSRLYRHRMWWEGIKDLPYARTLDGLVHAGKGFRREWEDVFCAALGVTWREQRDECADYSKWRSLLPLFIQDVCHEWGLPAQPAPEALIRNPDLEPASKRLKIAHHTPDKLPRDHGPDCPDILWQRRNRSFAFVVDCQPLAQILNGTAPLKAIEMQPTFERMTAKLFGLLDAGWNPHESIADPIIWHGRENNKIADFIVNMCMDNRSDWSQACPPPVSCFEADGCIILCHTDGGTRANSCSATGCFIEAVMERDGYQHVFPIAMFGPGVI